MSRPPRSPRVRAALAAAATVAVSVQLAGCGVPTEGFEAIGNDELPERLRPTPPEETPTTNRAAPWIAEVFWVREDTLVPAAVTLGGPVAAEPLLDVLAAGPPDATANLRTAFQDASLVRGTEQSGDTLVVDLDDEFPTAAGADQVRALGQLVFSLTSMPGVERVRFTVDGEEVAVPTPDGDVVERPVSRGDYGGLIDLSSLIRPGEGAVAQ